ncbi:MAG: hypothetical protein K9G76_08440 [Bacteroidales bacterium]|nr:hypothetical protein [Bacteroidales bacterium]MCF8403486.1 hypothetical protein [Bacteroidales bacterium]
MIPLIKIFKIGKIISNEEAAIIIGKHFSNVSDKLLNALQLQEFSKSNKENDLLLASIDQKIKELKPIPFQAAVNFRVNKRYLRYLIIPVSVLLVIFLASPKIITDPADRLIHYASEYEVELPFDLIITNEKLEVMQYSDYELSVKAKGEVLPEKVFLRLDNMMIKLNKLGHNKFSHIFNNVQEGTNFQLISEPYTSGVYNLKVLPKPVIIDFEVELDYPEYTGKQDEVIRNIGDHIVPEGSKVTWIFTTENTEKVYLHFDSTIVLKPGKIGKFSYSDRFFKDYVYSISSSNQFIDSPDSLSYTLGVLPDRYPQIFIDEYQDSIFSNQLYFNGAIQDDYGFSSLRFVINTENESNVLQETILLNKFGTSQEFFYHFDFTSLAIPAAKALSYYFEVFDNDQINGFKATKSNVKVLKIPDLKEVNEEKEKSNDKIKDEIEETIKDIRDLQNKVEKIQKKLIDKKELNWEDKEQIRDLLQQQQALENKIEDIQKENITKSQKEQQYKEIDESILEKQKQLEELFEKLVQNEELKKLFDELQKLMEEADKEKVDELLDDMKLTNEELEKALDRNLELFKQLEFEQKLDETIDKLYELAKKQEELSTDTQKKDNPLEEIKEEQGKIAEEFDDVKKELEDLNKMNEEMEQPNDFDELKEDQEQISEEMEDSQQQLEKEKRNKAAESQKKTSESMSKMAQSLLKMQQDLISEGMAEDIVALRTILENLIQLSFNQEELINRTNEININNPQYTGLIQEQKNLKDDLKVVEDSLYALSKRQIMIQPFVTQELTTITKNLNEGIEALTNRRTGQASVKQQYSMTSINNLALMLSETLNQMQQMMAMPSNGSCKSSMPKPGQGQGSIQSLRKLQEQLNKQIDQMKSGKKNDGGKKQQGQGKSGQSLSEQLARSAAQQEYIRNQLREMSEQLEKDGEFGSSKELKRIMNEMEKSESDLVNKLITKETLDRQKQILTRLLKSEKAELEREKDEKRESVESKNSFSRNPEEIFKYKRVHKNEVEFLRTVPPALQPFYKKKVDQYFFNFDELLGQ